MCHGACGIATFTHDVCEGVAGQYPSADCFIVAVNDTAEGYEYPPEVRFEIPEQDLDSYLRAADFLNFSNADVVCLQHEYGIYGGPAGSHILALLRDLRVPVVTTLHTVLREPTSAQRRVLKQLGDLSARLVVMSEKGKSFLKDIHGISEQKIDLIAHGIPDMPFVDPNYYKDQFGVEGKYVALTFGLLSPNKGIETCLSRDARGHQGISQLCLPRARGDASQSFARAGGKISAEPGADGERSGDQETRDLLQPIC